MGTSQLHLWISSWGTGGREIVPSVVTLEIAPNAPHRLHLASQGAPAAPPSKLSSEISSLRAALSCFCGQVEFVWVRWASSQLLIFTRSASILSVSWGCPGALSCLSCFTEGSFERGHQGKGCLKSCAFLWSMSSSRQGQSTYGSWGKAGRWWGAKSSVHWS